MTEKRERNLAIYRERERGATFSDIARRHDISASRAQLIYVRQCHRQGVLQPSTPKSARDP